MTWCDRNFGQCFHVISRIVSKDVRFVFHTRAFVNVSIVVRQALPVVGWEVLQKLVLRVKEKKRSPETNVVCIVFMFETNQKQARRYDNSRKRSYIMRDNLQ